MTKEELREAREYVIDIMRENGGKTELLGMRKDIQTLAGTISEILDFLLEWSK